MRNRFELQLFLAVLVLLATGGCASDPPPKLTGVENDYFTSLFEARPTYASAQGLHQYDGRLDDVSALALGRRADDLGRQLTRLLTLQTGDLNSQDRIDGALLENAVRLELLDLRHRKRWNSEPALYFDIVLKTIERTVRRQYTGPSERLNALVISINEIQAVMAAMRTNVVSPSRPAVEAALEACDRLRAVLRNELAEWSQQAAGVDGRLASSFEAGLGMSITSADESRTWMESELLPIATADYRIDAENLVMALLFDSMVEIKLTRLMEIAQEMLERDYAAFVEAAGQVAPGKTPAAALALAARPAQTADFSTEGRNRITAILQRLGGSEVGPLPIELTGIAKFHVEETWASLQSSLLPYRTDLPAMEGGDERRDPLDGYLLISPAASSRAETAGQEPLSQFSLEELQLAAAASIVPGRYLQALHTLRYPTRAGRLLSSRVTRDGWAHYAEQFVAEEVLGGNDPRLQMILCHRALIRDCRFYTSIGIHAMEMSESDAIGQFTEWGLLDQARAELELRRVATDPMCLSEALGKHLILALRADYEKAVANESGAGTFHEEFLKQGGLPIPLIHTTILPRSDDGQ